ncbi:rhodanese-like domain-containing protein [Ligilactobacillus saerimneri]|uniref:rhodanese-like domain-containing protein n=1 Tax=Ligilactobacillus saerimneri TaxID=228229 RepID=UPI000426A1EB|nr:rhodanese-like domain-containing protein [Ligilactobacillus saerimneri]KRL74929.1 hypothetical protein FC54_GL000080 [Ligilactobacillus saerimneri DSM 16049]
MLLKISVLGWINIVLIIFLAYIGGSTLYTYFRGRSVAKLMTNDEFKAGMRKAQIIDVREKNSFDASHILGARNIPYGQFKFYMQSLSKDLPVYLYDDGKALSTRAAVQLHKAGYKQIGILKGGFTNWDGKKKKAEL